MIPRWPLADRIVKLQVFGAASKMSEAATMIHSPKGGEAGLGAGIGAWAALYAEHRISGKCFRCAGTNPAIPACTPRATDARASAGFTAMGHLDATRDRASSPPGGPADTAATSAAGSPSRCSSSMSTRGVRTATVSTRSPSSSSSTARSRDSHRLHRGVVMAGRIFFFRRPGRGDHREAVSAHRSRHQDLGMAMSSYPRRLHPDTRRPYTRSSDRWRHPGLAGRTVRPEPSDDHRPETAAKLRQGYGSPVRRSPTSSCAATSWGRHPRAARLALRRQRPRQLTARCWLHPTATSSCSATIRNGCLFVYSTNTVFDVTEPGNPHGYTKFRAFAVLDHGGNMSAAARALRGVA